MKAFLIDQKLTGNPTPPELQIQPVTDLRVQFSYKDFGIGLRWTDPDSSVWVKTVIKWSREQPTGDLETAGRTIVETTTKNQYKETTFVEAFAATNYYIWAITYGSNGTKVISEQIFLSADSFQVLDTTSIINAVDLQIHATNGWNVKYSIADVKNLSLPVVLSANDGTTLFDSSWITSIALTSTELFGSSNLLNLTAKDGRIFTYDSEETEAIDKVLPFQVNFGHIIQWKRPNQNSIFQHSDWPESTKNKEITEPVLLSLNNINISVSQDESGLITNLIITNTNTDWYYLSAEKIIVSGGNKGQDYSYQLSNVNVNDQPRPFTVESFIDNNACQEYTISIAYYISLQPNEKSVFQTNQIVYTPPAVFDWDTASWEDIYNLCVRAANENLDLHDFVSVGMTKQKDIDNLTCDIEVIGVNEESGCSSLTFCFKTYPSKVGQWGASTNTYINSSLYSNANSIKTNYFSNMRSFIVSLPKINNGESEISSLELWHLSVSELGNNAVQEGEFTSGNVSGYTRFTDNNSRIRKIPSGTRNIDYWTRTKNSNGAYEVTSGGTFGASGPAAYMNTGGGLAFAIGIKLDDPTGGHTGGSGKIKEVD